MLKNVLANRFLKLVMQYFLVFIALAISAGSSVYAATPVVKKSIPDQIAHNGRMFSMGIATDDIFSDPDGNDLTVTVKQADGSALPEWLSMTEKNINPNLIGVFGVSSARDVTVIGNYAYAAAGNKGLKIIDVSSPSNPRLVGTYRAIETDGNDLTVYGDNKKVNLSVEQVLIVGNYAYLSGSWNGFKIIDISDPSNPNLVGECEISRHAYTATAIADDYVYLVDVDNLYIIDISTPSQPRLVGRLDSIHASHIAITNNYAYVISRLNESKLKVLQVIDISIPSQPNLIRTYNIFGEARSIGGLTIAGNYAYVNVIGKDLGGLKIIDIVDRLNPHIVGSCRIKGERGYLGMIAISGNYAYVATYDAGVQIIDISIPSSPNIAEALNVVGQTARVVVTNNYVYVVDYDGSGLRIIDKGLTNKIYLKGLPTVSDLGILNLKAIASNGVHEASTPFSIDVQNNRPTLVKAIPEQVAHNGRMFEASFNIDSIFKDPDGDDLTVTVKQSDGSALPEWLNATAEGINPNLVGSLTADFPFKGSHSVAVVGDYAYMLSSQGLQIVDISNPLNPYKVGASYNFARSSDLAIAGNYAYVTDYETGLHIVDISNPSKPNLAGFFNTSSAIGVALAEDYAYVTDDGPGMPNSFSFRGFKIIDVSVPADLNLVGSFNNGVRGVTALGNYGNYAYLLDDSELKIIDVSNPSAPNLTGSCALSASPLCVTVVDNYAYVGNYRSELTVVDISNPYNPIIIGKCQTPNPALYVTVANNYAYVAKRKGGLAIIDISEPTNPNVVGEYVPKGAHNKKPGVCGVAIKDNYAYMTPYSGYYYYADNAFEIIRGVAPGIHLRGTPSNSDLGTLLSLTATASDGLEEVSASPFAISVQNKNAALVVKKSIPDQVAYKGQMFDLSFNTYDIFNDPDGNNLSVTIESEDGTPLPTWLRHIGPSLLKMPKVSSFLQGIAASDNHIYLPNRRKLQIFDISRPSSPILVGECKLNDANQVKVVDNYAYVVGQRRLQIVDINNSSNPTLVGQYDELLSYNGKIAVDGDYAYITSGYSGLQIIDISDPSNPELVTTYNEYDDVCDSFRTQHSECNVFGVTISGDYAYLALWNGKLLVVDISKPSNPHLVGTVDLPSIAYDVVVVDDYAYVANDKGGLQIIDIESPSKPFLVGALNLKTISNKNINSAHSVHIVDNYAYVADSLEGLKIIDISKPSQPRLVGKQKTKNCALDVVVVGDYAYVADQSGGLQVIENVTGKEFRLRGTPPSVGTLNLKATASNGVDSVSTEFSIKIRDKSSQAKTENTEVASTAVGSSILSDLFMGEEESLSSAFKHRGLMGRPGVPFGSSKILKGEINIDPNNDKGLTELHIASSMGFKENVQDLLNDGADVNKFTNDGFAPIHYAICSTRDPYYYKKSQEMVQLLVKYGADINIADKNFGLSPLHFVAINDFVKLISSTVNKLEEYKPKFLSRLIEDCDYCENQNLVHFLDDIKIDLGIPIHNKILSLITDVIDDIRSAVRNPRYHWTNAYDYPPSFLTNVNTKCNYCTHYNILRDIDDKMQKMPTKSKITLLHFAALTGQVETIRLLISKIDPIHLNLYINSADNLGRTALHFASQIGSAEATKLLIENGANVNLEKIYINDIIKGLDSPLHLAARYGYLDVAMILINNGADVNAKFYPGTPLHEAAAGGYIEIAKSLIDAGATVDSKNSLGNTPLHVASRLGHAGVVKVLINAGADVNKGAVFANSDHIRDVPPLYYLEDVPPLYMASAGGHTEVVKLLIDAEANLPDSAQFSGLEGEELIEELVNFGLSSFVESLIELKQLKIKYGFYATPLHIACEQGDIETVKVLLNAGANLHAVARNGDTVLIAASRQNDPELVKLLVEAEVDINKRNSLGWTPLYVAASCGNVDVVEYLLHAGANSRASNAKEIAGHMGYGEIASLIRSFDPSYSHSEPSPSEHPIPSFDNTNWEYEYDNSYAPFPSKQCKDWLEPTYQYYVGNGCSFMVPGVVGFKVTLSDDYERCDLHNEYLQVSLIERALSQANPFDKLRCLIEMGYDAQIALNFVCSACDVSAGRVFENNAKSFINTIEFLIDKGADVNKVATNYVNRGEAPLISLLKACAYKDNDKILEEKVRFLLEIGADPNCFDEKGKTPLYYLFALNRIEDKEGIFNLLLDYGADTDLVNQDGDTLLLLVSTFYYPKELLPMIVEAKAAINQEDKKGNTPLHNLLYKGKNSDVSALKYLISKGADVNRPNVEGVTPLHIAFSGLYDDNYGLNHRHWRPSRAEVLETLMDADANINPAVKDGATPFKPSFQRYDTKLIQLLIDLGADVNQETEQGITPLHMFTRLGNLEAVKVLIEAGADVMKEDDRGLTPLDIAYEEGHTEIVKILTAES